MPDTKNKTAYTDQDVTDSIHDFVDNDQEKMDSYQFIDLHQQW